MRSVKATILLALVGCSLAPSAEIRLGIIGTDTSHATAFTKLLNEGTVPGARVVAAFKGGSQDVENSASRVDQNADELHTKYGVEIVPDIPTLISKVDGVLIERVVGFERAGPPGAGAGDIWKVHGGADFAEAQAG